MWYFVFVDVFNNLNKCDNEDGRIPVSFFFPVGFCVLVGRVPGQSSDRNPDSTTYFADRYQ